MLGRAWATWIALPAVALVGFFAPAPQTASAAPEECAHPQLELELPQYARVGGWIVVTGEYEPSRVEVRGAVRVFAPGAAEAAYPLEVTDLHGGKFGRLAGQIAVPAPTSPNYATRVVLEWTESRDYGGGFPPYVCTARTAMTIPVVPQGGAVGDPSVPRLEGRFRMSFRVGTSGVPVEDRTDQGVWTLRPRCRYFGCETGIRSTRGLRGAFQPNPSGTRHDFYTNRYYGRRGTCVGKTINRFTGELIRHWKIRRAYYVTQEIKLWVSDESSTGLVTRFYGKSLLHFEPIRSAERRGCPDKNLVERSRGRLIRS